MGSHRFVRPLKLFILSVAAVGAFPLEQEMKSQQSPPPTAENKELSISRVEQKMLNKMMRERAKLRRKYPLEITILGLHHSSYEAPQQVAQLGWWIGNLNFMLVGTTPIWDPGYKSVEMKASATWYNKGEPMSIFCSSGALGRCMSLAPGTYVVRWRKAVIDMNGTTVDRIQIPMVTASGKTFKLSFDARPFDANRFRQ